MADSQLSAAPRPTHAAPHAAPHPMANPGYGKRTAPDQLAHRADDFTHLPGREAAVAAYVDRLPDGADISVKTLAKHLPYGQCALRTALNNLQAAGHLRRGREHVAGAGSARWITRTWFTRTPRDDAWWAAFTRGDVPQEREPPTRSRAFILLAALGRTTPALSLSHADCVTLGPLVARWFERGANDDEVRRALTTGLPTQIHSPAALVARRLRDKLPPDRTPAPRRTALRILECATCGAPGRPEALPGGTCAPCRGERGSQGRSVALTANQVRTHAAAARAAASHQHERTRACPSTPR
ncbi:hypothetical protein [Streptomyces lasiicapitis]|uniref:MarR family transcriptional regulator n=1 Tax=Streptomyces lasiicapitis TaxID=1923961 RepID=A0ABQ2M4Z5_9ACTN|nr:hypothetical protein GCM10012286_38950 [Streptomyces lasiicapitis]